MKLTLPRQTVIRRVNLRLPAEQYNPIRLGLSRLGMPLKVVVPGMRGFEMLLDDDLWLLRDHQLNDLPLVAWSRFQCSERSGLLEPVSCEQLHYHAYGTVLARNIIGEVAIALSRRRRNQEPCPSGLIVSLQTEQQ